MKKARKPGLNPDLRAFFGNAFRAPHASGICVVSESASCSRRRSTIAGGRGKGARSGGQGGPFRMVLILMARSFVANGFWMKLIPSSSTPWCTMTLLV